MSRAVDNKPKSAVITRSPSGKINQDILHAEAEKSDARLYDQGITYNEPGITYNEIGIAYGGVYGAQGTRPPHSLAQSIHPTIARIDDLPPASPIATGNILQGQDGAFLQDQSGGYLFDQT